MSEFKSMGIMLQGVLDPRHKDLLRLMISNLKNLDERLSVLENPDPPVWNDLPIVAGWVNFDDSAVPASYSKDDFGKVHIRGVIKSGTVTDGTVIATLPSGYRPCADTSYPIADPGASGAASITVRSSGDMEVYGLSVSTEVSIAGTICTSLT